MKFRKVSWLKIMIIKIIYIYVWSVTHCMLNQVRFFNLLIQPGLMNYIRFRKVKQLQQNATKVFTCLELCIYLLDVKTRWWKRQEVNITADSESTLHDYVTLKSHLFHCVLKSKYRQQPESMFIHISPKHTHHVSNPFTCHLIHSKQPLVNQSTPTQSSLNASC